MKIWFAIAMFGLIGCAEPPDCITTCGIQFYSQGYSCEAMQGDEDLALATATSIQRLEIVGYGFGSLAPIDHGNKQKILYVRFGDPYRPEEACEIFSHLQLHEEVTRERWCGAAGQMIDTPQPTFIDFLLTLDRCLDRDQLIPLGDRVRQ